MSKWTWIQEHCGRKLTNNTYQRIPSMHTSVFFLWQSRNRKEWWLLRAYILEKNTFWRKRTSRTRARRCFAKEEAFIIDWQQPWTLCVCLGTQLRPALCNSLDCSPPGSSVHGNSPAKNTGVGWHALPSRGSSQPRDWIHVSCIAGGFFIVWSHGFYKNNLSYRLRLKDDVMRCRDMVFL